MQIKTLGERNSGTNYLDDLIELNFRVRTLRGTIPKYLDKLLFSSERMRDLFFRDYPSPESWLEACYGTNE